MNQEIVIGVVLFFYYAALLVVWGRHPKDSRTKIYLMLWRITIFPFLFIGTCYMSVLLLLAYGAREAKYFWDENT